MQHDWYVNCAYHVESAKWNVTVRDELNAGKLLVFYCIDQLKHWAGY